MLTTRIISLIGVLLSSAVGGWAGEEIVLETRDLQLTISADGTCSSVLHLGTNEQLAWTAEAGPAFSVVYGGRSLPASSVVMNGDDIEVSFQDTIATAGLRIIRTNDYLALRLDSISEPQPDEVHLLELRLRPFDRLATWINAAYGDQLGICLCGGSRQSRAQMWKPSFTGGPLVLRISAHQDPGLQGAIAVLFGCPEPDLEFLDRMAIVESDFGLPPGAANRQNPVIRHSYLWADATPDDIHEHIRWAKKGGFRNILVTYRMFSRAAGHFEWNDNYPNGMTDLKAVMDAIRDAGLAAGLHIHYSKAEKTDPYVTPVPDPRLHVVRQFTFSSAVDADTTTIFVHENPQGCTLDDGRRILRAGTELIDYDGYTTQPPYRFTNCERGALNTLAQTHNAGDPVGLLNVDTWPIFIRFDQNTDIQDEVAARLEGIFAETGPYDMVYFDGAEDVHDPFWYHCANAQWRVFRRFDPMPPVCEAAANTHFSWHMMTRSNAFDYPRPSEIKEFCRTQIVPLCVERALNFSRMEFGWINYLAYSSVEYIRPDALEFVVSRAAAWDCPISFRLRLGWLVTNPRSESCFELMKTWEDARLEGRLNDTQREQLKELAQEHHLFINESGDPELVEIEELHLEDGGMFLALHLFSRPTVPNDAYLLLCAVADDVDLTIPASSDTLTAMRPFGQSAPVDGGSTETTVHVGERMYVAFHNTDRAGVRQIMGDARSSAGNPVVYYRQAERYDRREGGISVVQGPLGGNGSDLLNVGLVPTVPPPGDDQQRPFVEYRFDIPYSGRWFLWGRSWYADGGSNSWRVAIDNVPGSEQTFGNGSIMNEWFWDTCRYYSLQPGLATVRITLRESRPGVSPILDVLCLTNDPTYRPSDADAVSYLRTQNPQTSILPDRWPLLN